jgi:hypothetical protein
MPTRTITQIETNQLSTLPPALVEVGREVPLAALLLTPAATGDAPTGEETTVG